MITAATMMKGTKMAIMMKTSKECTPIEIIAKTVKLKENIYNFNFRDFGGKPTAYPLGKIKGTLSRKELYKER